MRVLECVINISEGADTARIDALAQSVSIDLLDVHSDADHNRSVFTLAGVEAPRILARKALEILDLSHHEGVHPRVGIIDVVPFVAIEPSTFDDALRARDDFARFAADELGIPCFLYGPERTLPYIRKHAFADLLPDHGPHTPHPQAGAICVGARPILIAYNLWLKDATLETAKEIAKHIRSESVRALGLQVGPAVQVSMNLIDPAATGPDAVWDLVERYAAIDHAELVGLVPARTLAKIDRSRWAQLDLASDKTIEARFARRNQLRA
jgi:glutamate formiminotransferase